MIEKMIEERDQLQRRLNWLGLRSTGSERIEKRINELNGHIEGYYMRFKPPDRHIHASRMRNRVNGSGKIKTPV